MPGLSSAIELHYDMKSNRKDIFLERGPFSVLWGCLWENKWRTSRTWERKSKWDADDNGSVEKDEARCFSWKEIAETGISAMEDEREKEKKKDERKKKKK